VATGSFNDQQRFVLAIGAAVDRVADVPAVKLLARLDHVVLVDTSYRTALDIRDTADVIIRIFDSEADARRAFELFQH
jgi:hypothetical protein